MARAKRGAPCKKVTKAVTEASEASEASEAVDAVEAPPPVRLTAQDREAVAGDVLDLTLLLLQRRLRDEPDKVQASGIAEVTKLLGLFYRYRDKLDKGAEADGWLDYLKDVPTFADDDDADDPLLQGNRDHNPAPAVSPADIAALATFED